MGNNVSLESILDLNSNNIWNVEASEVAKLWEDSKIEDNFISSEEKLLNIIRLAFEVVHYNADNEREKAKYENGEWELFSHMDAQRGCVAIRKKHVSRLTDLSYENVKHITTATLLELIDCNFGGGWDSIQLSIKDIIESGFDITTTQLPASRIHAPGSLVEKKLAQGYEVLEIQKGTWVEAIFAKKKEPLEKLRCVKADKYDEDGNLIEYEDEEDELKNSVDEELDERDDEVDQNDDTFYSSYAPEAEVKDEDEEEGFSMIEE